MLISNLVTSIGIPVKAVLTPKQESTRWFDEEVRPHESSLRSYIRAVFPQLPDIDDLVQESYVRLIRAKEAGPIIRAKAYLFTTARNAALDFFRRRKIISIENVADFENSNVIDDSLNASDALNKQQELETLSSAVRSLPPRCRQVMTLRLLYGMPQKEIAQELKISEHTVKAQLAKGMRKCAEYFDTRGIKTYKT